MVLPCISHPQRVEKWKRLSRFGHNLRQEEIPGTLVEGRMLRQRIKGRSRVTCIELAERYPYSSIWS